VVVYGKEYFGGGIQSTAAGATQYGSPVRVVDLDPCYPVQEAAADMVSGSAVVPHVNADSVSFPCGPGIRTVVRIHIFHRSLGNPT
jgi:hypothetical protein